MSAMELISRYIAYPLWDLKDRSQKLNEYRRLSRSEWKTAEEMAGYRLERLQRILEHAYATVPYYRDHWLRDPIVHPIKSPAEMIDFPILTKEEVRNHKSALVSDEYKRAELIEAKTGGSTGVALELLFDKTCEEFRNAAALRSDEWAGWSPGQLVGALWGTPPIPTTFKEKVRNLLLDRVFFLDTMDLNDDSMGQFISEVQRREPKAIFGHAHSIYILARYIEKSKLKLPKIPAVVSTSMMLLEPHRTIIERVFGTKVTNRYGCEEVGLIACECEKHSGLHINSDHVLVEVVDEGGKACPPGIEGRLILTDFNNRGMPLIRYEVGDVAAWRSEACSCGRGLRMIENIRGRTADYLVRSDGSRVSGISLVEKSLTAISGVDQLQIIQRTESRFVLNVVPGKDFSAAADVALLDFVREVFGPDAEVELNHLSSLEQLGSGKYRFAICELQIIN